MFVNVTGMGQVRRLPRAAQSLATRSRRGMGSACPLEDAPLGCSPSGAPWQATGGGVANNFTYFDAITGKALDLANACYINGNLLVNCDDTGYFGPQGPPQPAGPITDVSQTAAYLAANAAANAAYVPPTTAPPGYTITQPNSAPSSTGGTGGGSGSGSGSTPTGSAVPTTPAGCFAPLAQFGIPDSCVGGLPVGLATIAAGIAAVFILASVFGGKH
jgi:hypothetical protein